MYDASVTGYTDRHHRYAVNGKTAGAFLVIPSEQNEDYTIVACLVKNEGDTPVWTRTTGLTRGALAITCECEYQKNDRYNHEK